MQVISSYEPQDVTFLLKDITDAKLEQSNEARERAIQAGVHYSEMLPIEYEPSKDYWQLYKQSLTQYKREVAIATGVVGELLLAEKGEDIVLVSLVRAGTPVGILLKRYLQTKGVDVPHYSISIIRGRGIDTNALSYITKQHPERTIVFVDGWTGKGAITEQLITAVDAFNELNGTHISADLAVLADPAECATYFGTRKDFLIPSSCLNSVVSGLVSRSVLNDKLIGPHDFHGAKVYHELASKDVSRAYIATIVGEFAEAKDAITKQLAVIQASDRTVTWAGMRDIITIQEHYGIVDHNLVKPGVGETTRVLLRRMPWKILVKDMNDPSLTHIFQLAKERGVTVEPYQAMNYACCGLIRPIG
ncbi:Cysteine protease StiP precursor [Metalysinibacillus saudimassiliensis]|uniref:Cysteine protease StiP n=1 Tax=Metalysinibacillus saudimassiliensis TaxID=1461583 RepID=A0A078LYI4_9BACL|nr:Cysteine protease StiP precursor [Metalysinibacillus saudimassiliensis]